MQFVKCIWPGFHLYFLSLLLSVNIRIRNITESVLCFHCLFLQELEDFETVSDFEVLIKSSHGHNGPDGSEREEFNNYKDYNQEKPSKLKQR